MTNGNTQANLRTTADLIITLTDPHFALVDSGTALNDIVLGSVGNIASIAVRVGTTRCEGIVTINATARSVDVELGELAMMQLRDAQGTTFLDSPTFRFQPADTQWQEFDRVTVERVRGREARPGPSLEEVAALEAREAECRRATQQRPANPAPASP